MPAAPATATGLVLSENYRPETHNGKTYYFLFNDIDKLTGQFKGFEIEPIKEESSILKIALKGNNVAALLDSADTAMLLTREFEPDNFGNPAFCGRVPEIGTTTR